MITFEYSEEGWTLDASGNIKTISRLDALRQRIEEKFALFRGAWFLNLSLGLPYNTSILASPIDAGLIVAMHNALITDEPEVESIVDVSANLDRETRRFTYRAVVRSIFGDMEIIQ